jgi:hypothetical protein
MTPSTFLQTLKAEVARMQTLHPERAGDLARAHALILHGQVLPSADDPATGHVLSSDGEQRYTVNGSCDCQAGEHGKACKHMHAWKLYRYIQGKVEAQAPPDQLRQFVAVETPPLPEAPVSITLKASFDGQEVLVTLRGHDFASVKAQVEDASAWLKAHAPTQTPQGGGLGPAPEQEEKRFCPVHGTAMQLNHKDGRQWWSHRTADGQWCKGKK